MKCENCGKKLEEIVGAKVEVEVYEILSVPDKDFKVKVLGHFCKECFKELSSGFIKKHGEKAIIEQC